MLIVAKLFMSDEIEKKICEDLCEVPVHCCGFTYRWKT